MQKTAEIFTVSRVNALIKTILANNLPGWLTVAGEITNWKVADSGHWYFSLKDEQCKLPCVMWRSNLGKVKFEAGNGVAVLAHGHIDVYALHGKYQFYVQSMEPAGVGSLRLVFEQMYKRLKAEGLFEESHKKSLPRYPQRIGILTSESGAAVQDIVQSINDRWPCVELFLYPVPVQGEGAAEGIAAAIRDVNVRNEQLRLDMLIVGRGGGSLEDLWAFNEEVVARAIFDSAIAIISAVGHEIDTTIADLVADARASTPTKAGVAAVPDAAEVRRQLTDAESRLASQVRAAVRLGRQHLETVLAGELFKKPFMAVRNREQQLDEAEGRVHNVARDLLVRVRQRLDVFGQAVRKIEPHRLLGGKAVEVSELAGRVRAGVKGIVGGKQMELTARENRLAGLNPRGVLQRGYSITRHKQTGAVVRRAAEVEVGQLLITELAHENLIESNVVSRQNSKSGK